MMNGATITARTIPAARMLNPVGWLTANIGTLCSQSLASGAATCSTNGTIASSPQTPYTTGGIAASRSRTGFAKARVAACAYSDRYSATSTHGSTAKPMPTTVTHAVPAIKGQNPNRPSFGFHVAPRTVSGRGCVPNTGHDLTIRATVINRIKKIGRSVTTEKVLLADSSALKRDSAADRPGGRPAASFPDVAPESLGPGTTSISPGTQPAVRPIVVRNRPHPTG